MIYYTTDGSDPKVSGTRLTYYSPIYVSQDTIIKAVAKSDNNQYSEVLLLDLKISYGVTQPSYTIQYYKDEGLTEPLPDPPYLKAGTYFLKILTNKKLSTASTLSIDAQGSLNDVNQASVVRISDCVYRYSRVIIDDLEANGDVQEEIYLTGTDINGNQLINQVPLNAALKAAYLDTQPPAVGSIELAGGTSTNDRTPLLNINSSGAAQMRLALSETELATATWVNYAAQYDDFDVSPGGNGNKTLWIEFRDRAGNIQTQHASTTFGYNNSILSFDIEYFSDSGLANSLGNNPRLKAGTYYLKITANQNLGYSPTIQIDAEGSNNDVSGGSTSMVNQQIFYYTRTIVADAAAIGAIKETITIQGISPSNVGTKAAYTDTVAPAAPAVTGLSTTHNLRPTWSWNNVIDAVKYRYSFTDDSNWTETTAISYTPASNLAEGSHTLYVQAVDPVGNWSNSGSFNTTITTAVPIVSQGTYIISNGSGNYNFGYVNVNSNKDITFTITNTGTGILNLIGTPEVQLTGNDSSQFSIVTQPSSPILPNGKANFTVRFTPTGCGVKTAIITIPNDGSNNTIYTFTVSGVGSAPQIVIKQNGTIIPSGTGSFNFGDVSIGAISNISNLIVQNLGNTALNLTGDPKVEITGDNASDFSVTSEPASSISASTAVSFKIAFSPTGTGIKTATVNIASDDPDTNPYTFTITGNGVPPASLALNTWTQGNLVAGDVRLYSFNATIGSHYLINWDDSYQGSQMYNCDIKVSGYRQDLTTLYFNNIDSGYSNPQVITAQESVIFLKVSGYSSYSSGSYALKVTEVIPGPPVINVKIGTTDIPNGTIGYNFGDVPTYSSSYTNFTIQNLGTTVLNLTGNPKIQIGGPDASQFRVTMNPVSPISFYGNSQFNIEFTPTSIGNKTATVSIESDDPANNPYTFTITGNGTDIEPQLVLDSWLAGNIINTNYKKTYYFNATVGKSYAISWDDRNEGTGTYTGDILVSSYRQDFTTSYFGTIDRGYLTPQIITAQDDIVYIRIYCWSLSAGSYALQVSEIPSVPPTITIKQGTTDIPNEIGSYDFGSVFLKESKSVTFTIRNSGTTDLNLSGSPKVLLSGPDASRFTITSQPYSTIRPYGSTSFEVKFTPYDLGVKTATLSITSDDPNTNTYTFTITGTGTAPPSINLGSWISGNLTNWDDVKTYSFNATIGSSYYVSWDDSGQGSGVYTGDIHVAAYRQDLNTSYFGYYSSGYTTPEIITAQDNIVYLCVNCYMGGTPGTFALKVTEIPPGPPVINIKQGATDIPNGAGVFDFGDISMYSEKNITFTIQNKGAGDLNLSGDPIVSICGPDAALFKVTSIPSSVVPLYSSRTFSIIFTPTSTGSKTATVTIANNDPHNNPYVFTITGNGTAAEPELTIGEWRTGNLDVGDIKTYYFTATIGKSYTVNWDDKSEGSGAYSCDIRVSAYRKNLSTLYSGADDGYTTPLTVTAQDDIVYLKVRSEYSNYDNTGSFALKVAELPPGLPVFSLMQGTTNIPNETGSCDFGDVSMYSRKRISFSIKNTGNSTLNLTGSPSIQISGANASEFSIYVSPITAITPHNSASFTISFNPTSTGAKTATVSIANNDSGNDPYTFTITGNGTPAEPTLTLDTWMVGNLTDGDVKTYSFNATIGKKYTISWDDRFEGSGVYTCDVLVSALRADLITAYFLYKGDGYIMPQVITAQDSTVYIRVEQWNYTGSFALKVAEIIPGPPVINVKQGTNIIPSGTGSYNFGDVSLHSVINSSFTVQNTGTTDLNLTGAPKVQINGADADQFIVTTAPASPIAPYESATFRIGFAPKSTGTKTAVVSISNDDSGNNPYTFTITGNGTTIETITAEDWTVGSLYEDDVKTYCFNATVGKMYSITWDDGRDGTGTYFGDVDVFASRPDLTSGYFSESDGYTIPQVITAQDTIVYLKVRQMLYSGTFAIKVTEIAPGAPVFNLKHDNTSIVNGSGSYDFGDVPSYSKKYTEFCIQNIGTGDLILTSEPKIQISGPDASLFYVLWYGGATILPSNKAYFTVVFSPNIDTGSKTATISISNNDTGNNPYTFTVTGNAIAPEIIPLDTWSSCEFLGDWEYKFYSFQTVVGKEYSIYWDEREGGSDTYTAYIDVSACRTNLTYYFSEIDSGYISPQVITALDSSIYIKVYCNSSSSTNIQTFALKVVETPDVLP